MIVRAALPAALLALGACATTNGFPSLAPRPAERDISIEEPVRPPVAVPNDDALRQRLEALRQQAAEGDRAFEAAYGPAEAAVARAGAPESERWVDAQQMVSRLEAARVQTAQAASALDQLALGRADQPTSEEDLAALEAAVTEIEAIAARQHGRLESLRSRLSRP